MIHDEFPGASLHNVAETAKPEWAETDASSEVPDGHALHRVPERVRSRLNVGARERYREPAGCELRLVPTGEAPVEVRLSAPEPTVVHPFWGPFQPDEPREVGPGPTTLSLAVPDRIGRLRAAVPTGAFAPRVCRLRFDAWTPVAVHDVRGPCRPPTDDELPDRRLLAYGTSITEGASASAAHLTYVARLARAVGVDSLNLGTAGTAYCEPAMAEYLASRRDWDVATLAVSVNMANRGFTVDQFRERARHLVDRVAASDPSRPVVAVSLFPYHADLVAGDDSERARDYRDALADAVADSSHGNCHFVSGRDVMDATGLTTDLLHPGDAGMAAIADGLATALDGILE